MPLSDDVLQRCATTLHTAARTAHPTSQLTLAHPELTLDEAYTIQRALIARRIAEGERLVGMKMGLTSRAKMIQVGVHAPIYGHLTSGMVLADGGTLARASCCHPRIEPEIAFVMARALSGTPSPAQALAAVAGVTCALEVIDSRYENFKFTLPDVVADNASSSRFVVGSTLALASSLDLANLAMVMRVNGKVREVGASSAILDHPARSLAMLAALLAERGEEVPAGAVVLAGGATAAVALSAGDRVSLEVASLGRVECAVV